MNILTWIILFILGFSCITAINSKSRLLYRAGLAFPIGFGINSFVMILLDLLGIAINNLPLILGIDFALSVLFTALLFRLNKPALSDFKNIINIKDLWPINLAWLVLVAAISYVAYAMISKTIFWPPSAYDSIHGYDFLAKAINLEGTFNNSIFDKDFLMSSVRSYYPPLVPLSLSLGYMAGLFNTKVVMAFYFASIILTFYHILKQNTSHLSAAFFTLLLIITPEYAAFSAMSSPNPPCTFYSAIGLLSFYHWYNSNKLPFFITGTILIAFALWTRTETIIFAASSGLLVLLKSIRDKKFKLLIIYAATCLFVLVAWQLYLKLVLVAESRQPVITHFIFDLERLGRMMTKVKTVTFNTIYYGWSVYFFLGMIALNIRNIIKYKDQLILLASIFITWIFYLAIYHQIDTDFLPGQTEWIEAGYKRGFFYFLPLMYYYCANNRISLWVFNRLLSINKNH